MKRLAKVQMRCRDHENSEPRCDICVFLRRAETELVSLGSRRDRIFRELKERLAKRELIIVDLC